MGTKRHTSHVTCSGARGTCIRAPLGPHDRSSSWMSVIGQLDMQNRTQEEVRTKRQAQGRRRGGPSPRSSAPCARGSSMRGWLPPATASCSSSTAVSASTQHHLSGRLLLRHKLLKKLGHVGLGVFGVVCGVGRLGAVFPPERPLAVIVVLLRPQHALTIHNLVDSHALVGYPRSCNELLDQNAHRDTRRPLRSAARPRHVRGRPRRAPRGDLHC